MDFTALTRDPAAYDEWRNRAFPFFQKKIFLTHASVSPLPYSVARAIGDYALSIATDGQWDFMDGPLYCRGKERVAQLLGHGATTDEIAYANSTSHALGLVATGLDWRPGDNCIVADGDFPANVVTWKNLRHTRGVEVRMIPHRPALDITLEDVIPLVDRHTRIVSLASANFLSGYPVDLATIGAWLHERGVLLCVDAIQTLGAMRMDLRHVDFVCADAHKWLLGPNGIAILWARQAALEKLQPAILGWLSTRNRDNWFAYDTTPIPSAQRLEPGAQNFLGVVGLDAALQLLDEIGAVTIEERVIHLRNYAAQRLRERGCKLLWDPSPASRAGIITFNPPDGDATTLYQKLDPHFALSLRQDHTGQPWLRVSPHFMNTEADIDQLVSAI